MNTEGRLIVVGTGMTLGAHISPICRNSIEQADVVFIAASHSLVEEWVMGMNDDVRSLQGHYRPEISRMDTYRNMVRDILAEVHKGRSVCAAFYGHPGVFTWAPHEVIKLARKAGIKAHMEPGISAEDCLYADLGIDPGRPGCVHYEATRFLLHRKTVDTAAWLVLWQMALTGDQALRALSVPQAQRQLLVDALLDYYPPTHPVTLYECAVLPIETFRADVVQLVDLAAAEMDIKTTVVLPPAGDPVPCEETRKKLEKLRQLC